MFDISLKYIISHTSVPYILIFPEMGFNTNNVFLYERTLNQWNCFETAARLTEPEA